jgi:carbon-monoxide dehydrogenase medium subunit
MIPAKFDYYAPTSLGEALKLLSEHAGSAKILAGGQSLIPAMRFRLSTPEVLVDLNKIEGLDYIKEVNGHLAIGALTRESAIDKSSLIQQKYPLLADTAKVIADPLVRNLATMGGNLAHADPANDHPATVLSYGAKVVAVGPKGERTIPIDDFFTGLFENCLEPNEILKEVQIPTPPANSGGAYLKIERKVGDYAVAAVAVQLTLEGDICKAVRIGLTNVSTVPMRAKSAETILLGNPLTEENIKAASVAAAADSDPTSDLRGTAEYKRDLVRVITKRALRTAIQRAKGEA